MYTFAQAVGFERGILMEKTLQQRQHLLSIGDTLANREDPLGTGLRRECWAGLAITIANSQSANSSEFYGLSMREIIDAVKMNNSIPPAMRNDIMVNRTTQFAAS